MRRGRPGASPGGAAERTLTSVGAGDGDAVADGGAMTRGAGRGEASRLWHITLSV